MRDDSRWWWWVGTASLRFAPLELGMWDDDGDDDGHDNDDAGGDEDDGDNDGDNGGDNDGDWKFEARELFVRIFWKIAGPKTEQIPY